MRNTRRSRSSSRSWFGFRSSDVSAYLQSMQRKIVAAESDIRNEREAFDRLYAEKRAHYMYIRDKLDEAMEEERMLLKGHGSS